MKVLELTPQQRRLYIEWKINPNSNAYNLTNCQFKLKGKLDIKRLESALKKHREFEDTIRTYFTEVDDEPSQVILDPKEIDQKNKIISFVDLTSDIKNNIFDPITRLASLEEIAKNKHKNILQKASDLTQYPLIVYHLIKYAEDNYLFTIVIPHILIDATCKTSFIETMFGLYNHPNETIKNLKIQCKLKNMENYLNHIKTISEEIKLKDSFYWKENLKGLDSLQVKLPNLVDKNSLQIKTNVPRGMSITVLSKSLSTELQKCALDERTTLFIIMLTLFNVLIYRFTKQKDIIVGYSVNVRPKDFYHLTGFFVNNLPLKIQLEDNLSLKKIIQLVMQRRLQDRLHQNYSLENIIGDLRTINPQFDRKLFNLACDETYVYPKGLLSLEGVTVEPGAIPRSESETLIDLAFEYGVLPDGRIECSFTYDPKILDAETINNLHMNWQVLLEVLLKDSKCMIGEISLPFELKEYSAQNDQITNKNNIEHLNTMKSHEVYRDEIRESWLKVLKKKEIGLDDNIFSIGGDSLGILKIYSLLSKEIQQYLTVTDLFLFPTINKLVNYLVEKVISLKEDESPAQEQRPPPPTHDTDKTIAIIGLAGIFPGANNVKQFWENLFLGKEGITFFSKEELIANGIPLTEIEDPNYVPAKGIIQDYESFDASFFDYTPRDADIMDPQHRLFLMCAHHALEDAGYGSRNDTNKIGIFAGSGINYYLLSNLWNNVEIKEQVGDYKLLTHNINDTLATNVAFKLNLTGSAVSIQTACSSSLAAVHFACESLLKGENDMVLAGGVSLSQPKREGYLYQQGMIKSKDGHCRAFDAKASGTITGQGVGIILLKRLKDALKDRDHIYGVIKGSAINNDGADKLNFSSPSRDRQSEVIQLAQERASIHPETISYIETHGTGTPIGDPIEISALTQAFRKKTNKNNFCAIGSVKTNIGHTDAAAGVIGLIKTVLSIQHKMIPPSLHFDTPNPEIDFKNSPFYVNSNLQEWSNEQGIRRAGVSSFGIGGTNTHVILEEAPLKENTVQKENSYHLMVLSAKTQAALTAMQQNFLAHLEQHPEENLQDVVYTLQVGRQHMDYKHTLVFHSRKDAIDKLKKQISSPMNSSNIRYYGSPVFMFPGQGSQYIGMALDLLENESLFKDKVVDCLNILKKDHNFDLSPILFQIQNNTLISEQINSTEFTQPALFIIEYSLACLWISWGIKPTAMIGHSLGEYVAACISGVLTLEEALFLIYRRSQLIKTLPCGMMLSIKLSEEEILPYLNNEIFLASINSPTQCVISGTISAVKKLETELLNKHISCQVLQTSHGFHSGMLDPILLEFENTVRKCKLNKPRIPYISNVTGTWITPQQVADPQYWVTHLRNTVYFSKGIRTLLNTEKNLFLEVGPGNVLGSLTLQNVEDKTKVFVLNSIRTVHQKINDKEFILNTLGKLWQAGIPIDWESLYQNKKPSRIPLPTYPFELRRHWIEAPMHQTVQSSGGELINCLYKPVWKKDIKASEITVASPVEHANWLVFIEDKEDERNFTDYLEKQGQNLLFVYPGEGFNKINDNHYEVNPSQKEDFLALMNDLALRNVKPDYVYHFWILGNISESYANQDVKSNNLTLNFMSGVFIVQTATEVFNKHHIKMIFVAYETHNITGHEQIKLESTLLLGLSKVVPQEYLNVECVYIDIDRNLPIETLVTEMVGNSSENLVAYREDHKWIRSFENINIKKQNAKPTLLKRKGVYLITGGLGGLGLIFAEYLIKKYQAEVILINRKGFLSIELWNQWLVDHDEKDEISKKIKKLQKLNLMGGKIQIFSADVGNTIEISSVLGNIKKQGKIINGVIHAAGIVKDELIQNIKLDNIEKVLNPKVKGTLNLYSFFLNEPLDFFVNYSSLCTILGGIGIVDYCAANSFLDAFASYAISKEANFPVTTVNWPAWYETGMSQYTPGNSKGGISQANGAELLELVLSQSLQQIIVSSEDVDSILDKQNTKIENAKKRQPSLTTQDSAFEKKNLVDKLVHIWQGCLGHENVTVTDNFFELGGDSLTLTQIYKNLPHEIKSEINIIDLFQYPTILSLIEYLQSKNKPLLTKNPIVAALGKDQTSIQNPAVNFDSDRSIAIIGLSGAFPGAYNVKQFWENVCNGKENISFFTDQELLEAGIPPADLSNFNYVKARGIIHEAECFDAAFFQYTPREATIMDPQHRLFLMHAYHALEDAGYDPDRYSKKIGVFAGCGMNNYLISHLVNNVAAKESVGEYKLLMHNMHDTLATTVSYNLNLTGSAVTVQTACSTSLVAIHLACQSLVANENDIVLAGGVFLGDIRKSGYFHQEGMISSADGHCRAFDADANGTVMSQGLGIVVLKRLEAALQDKDHIYAIIKGSAINNDGSKKMSFTSPSSQQQANVIEMAHTTANVHPETISYIEAHGTGTKMGDPIEILALTKAFQSKTLKKQFCAIGSVKANIGHTDVASGVTGLIKAALSLQHKIIPAHINYKHPNPEIDFENSPFYVNTETQKWQTNGFPRRAGVSSFGIGGTNAHVILEEAPQTSPILQRHNKYHLLIFSALTETALDKMTENLALYFTQNPQADLANVSFTLQIGRKQMPYRRMLICSNIQEALKYLKDRDPTKLFTSHCKVLNQLESFSLKDKDELTTLNTIGKLWLSGVSINWQDFYQNESVSRISLPIYPFETKRYLIDLPENRVEHVGNEVVKTNQNKVSEIKLNEIENILLEIWQEFLGLSTLNLNDDFFEIGGDSLLSIQMTSNLSKRFHIKLLPQDIINFPTINKLSEVIRNRLNVPEDDSDNRALTSSHYSLPFCIVNLNSYFSSDKAPLFIVHGIGGSVSGFRDLATQLNRQVYGIQSKALDQISEMHVMIPEMAKHYCESIQKVQPRGPYFLSGYSLGGAIAYEMAQQFYDLGEQVSFLAMFDTPRAGEVLLRNAYIEDDSAIISYMLYAGYNHTIEPEILRQMDVTERCTYFLKHAGGSSQLVEGFGVKEVQSLIELYRVNALAIEQYIPSPYKQKNLVTFYKVMKQGFNSPKNPERFWQTLLKENFLISCAHGNHHNMLQPSHFEQGLLKHLQHSLLVAENHLKRAGEKSIKEPY